jgi:hypothetical protein
MSPDPSRHVPLRQPTAFHVPVCLPPLPAANRKTCLLARPAMSLCARQHHSRDQAVSLPARSYSCNPSWGGGVGSELILLSVLSAEQFGKLLVDFSGQFGTKIQSLRKNLVEGILPLETKLFLSMAARRVI